MAKMAKKRKDIFSPSSFYQHIFQNFLYIFYKFHYLDSVAASCALQPLLPFCPIAPGGYDLCLGNRLNLFQEPAGHIGFLPLVIYHIPVIAVPLHIVNLIAVGKLYQDAAVRGRFLAVFTLLPLIR